MVLVVVAAFTISWTPYFIVSIVTQYQQVNFMVKHNYFFTMLCINMFGFLNSSINPIIYAVMSTRFRSGFASIARSLLLCSSRKSRRHGRSIASTGVDASGRLAASGSASGGSSEPVVARQSRRLTIASTANGSTHDTFKSFARTNTIKHSGPNVTSSSAPTPSTATIATAGAASSGGRARSSSGSHFLIRPFETLSNYHRK